MYKMFSYFSDSKTKAKQNETNSSCRNAQKKTSVHKNDNAKDLELGKECILFI